MMRTFVCLLLVIVPSIGVTVGPNVLLISIDTLRADHLGCYGYRLKTPSIDSLAARSVLFEQAISQVPMTLPSHATIFTGLYPDQHGIRNNENFLLADKFFTLAELFKANGYFTGAIIGSFSLDSTFGVHQGFDFYEDKIGKGKDPAVNRHLERRADSVWKIGRDWIDAQKKPWFCFLHFFDPHTGYQPPAPFPQSYDGEIAYVDQTFGEILRYLSDRDLWSTTIVVLLSDHGESLGEHGEQSHGVFVYDSTIRVPLLVAAPGVLQERISDQVRLVDVAPTIASLAGLKTSVAFAGQNLLPWKRRDLPAYSESYYTNLLMGWAPIFSVRLKNRKWIDAPVPEYYDLNRDPAEQRNLYSSSVLLREFRAELSKRRKAPVTGDGPPDDPEVREKLASLGYITGGSVRPLPSSFDPKNGIEVWNQIELAVSAAQTRDYKRAEQLFERVLQKQPDNVIAHKFLAAVLRKSGKSDKAVGHLTRALAFPLHQEETRRDLAATFYETKRYQDTLNLLEKPSAEQDFRLAGFAALHLKKYSDAVRFLKEAIKVDPTDADALSAYAKALARSKQDNEALRMYQKLAALRPLKEEEALQAAAIHLTSRNNAEAEKYFRLAIQANSKSVQAWKGLALILASKQEWEGALQAFVSAGDCASVRALLQKIEISSDRIEAIRKQCSQ